MAVFHNGFRDIQVELINFRGNELAHDVCCFGQNAEFYEGMKSVNDYNEDNTFCKQLVQEIINGTTFPKYALQGHSVSFSIKGISRICLAQFTREGTNDTGTFFCSASSGTRPLTQDQIIPMNIYANYEWMQRLHHINAELEKLYCDMLCAGVPFMDARYIMPSNQTIDICYTASISSFIGSCKKRFDNSIADEINYLYRLMKNCLKQAIDTTVTDKLSKQLWYWLLDKMDINTHSNNVTYLNDFKRFKEPEGYTFKEDAHNDWRKSQWKMELERIYNDEPHLLLPGEEEMIQRWLNANVLTATYNANNKFSPETSVKKMPYYKEDSNDGQ